MLSPRSHTLIHSPSADLRASPQGTLETVLRKLRRLPWDDPSRGAERFLVKQLLRVHKGKYSHVPLVASLAAGLSRFHDSLGVRLVDTLVEDLRLLQEQNEIASQQRRVAETKARLARGLILPVR